MKPRKKEPRKKGFTRKWIGRLHLWLGLASGVLVVLISLSGALYAFRDELFDVFHRDALYLENVPANARPLPLSRLLASAEKSLESTGASPRFLNTYSDPRQTWAFRVYESGSDSGVTYFDEVKRDLIVFVNPYDGTVVKVLDHKHEFFQLVKMFHWSFLLRTEIGQPIVGYSVLVFVLMLLSGMILWWPKKIRQVGAKLRIPWSAGWKSKVYALHTSLGMIALPVAWVIALTGLYYAFRVVAQLLYVVVALTTAPPDWDMGKSQPAAFESRPLALDAAYQASWKLNPGVHAIGFSLPEPGDDSATITAYVRENPRVYYRGARESYDRHAGTLVKRKTFDEAPRGEKYLAMNYDIHVGAILGLPGKILAFLASLVAASLPITGFFIWRGRRKKKFKHPKGERIP